MLGRVVRFRVGPGLFPALVISVPEQTGRRVVEMFVVDQKLFNRLGVRVFTIAKHLAVSHEERKRHKHAVCP